MVARLLLIIYSVLCLKTERIPLTGIPPVPLKSTCVAYNSSDLLYIFGGHEKSDKVHNEIYLYDIKSSSWSESIPISPSQPISRYNPGCFTYKSSFFIFGGNTNNGPINDLWSYNPIEMAWSFIQTETSPSFRYLFSFCSFSYNSKHYFAIYGGWKDEGLSSGFYILDVENLKWVKHNNGPTALAGSSMIFFNTTLIVFGGILDEDEMNSQFLFFNLETKEWTSENFQEFIPRSHFGAAEFNGKLFILFGWNEEKGEYESSVLSFDLMTFQFSLISIQVPEDILVQNYGFASDDKSLFVFGGLSLEGITNGLIRFSPNSKSLSVISEKYLSPRNLMNASLVRIATALFLFGGMNKETRYNDLWKFDLDSAKWSKTKSYGDIPGPRSHHSAGADGDIMVIFGGKDSTQYFNDAFQFNSLTLTWSELKYLDLNPSARFSACMVVRLPIIYIYGGETLSGFSLTLYSYNISDITYTKISDSEHFTPGNGQSCFLNDQGDEFRVLYGNSDGDEPLGYVQSFNFTSKKWKTLYNPVKNKYNRARAIIAEVNNNFYITGGSTWATSPRKEIMKLDIQRKNVTVIEKLDRVAYQAPFVRFKSKVFVYGGGSAYKELIRYDVAVRDFFAFDLFQVCTDDCHQVCAEGSYFNDSLKSCELCPPGFYSPFKGMNSCVECAAGTYNDKYGASSKRQCYPCNQGQFSPNNGSSLCFECQVGYYCPIGSAFPSFKYSESLVSYKQPKPFQRKTDEANFLAMQIQIIVGIIGFLIIISILPISRFHPYLTGIDQFDDAHNYEDEVPLVTRKTLIGGIFSFIYIILAIIVIVSAIVLYFMDNISENKSLIPFVVLKELTTSVKSNMQIEILLGNYGGSCTIGDSCSSSIFFAVSGLTSEPVTLNCERVGLDCNLKIDIKNFELESVSEFFLKLQEDFSYTSQITVKISSDSSIPNEKSEVKMIAYPKENHVFRGETPTTFRFSFTPSYFSNQEDGKEATGYHLAPLSEPSGGTAFEPTNLGFTADLQVRIVFERSNNGLWTERVLINTSFLIILTLIGSIPGIKDLVGFVMGYCEEKALAVRENQKKKDIIEKYRQGRINCVDFFSDYPSIVIDKNEAGTN